MKARARTMRLVTPPPPHPSRYRSHLSNFNHAYLDRPRALSVPARGTEPPATDCNATSAGTLSVSRDATGSQGLLSDATSLSHLPHQRANPRITHSDSPATPSRILLETLATDLSRTHALALSTQFRYTGFQPAKSVLSLLSDPPRRPHTIASTPNPSRTPAIITKNVHRKS
ncbi:uncharacterized protein K441DRAFT_264386 [Cenococcum geophilum 1.58]|uniref:uncharacterized protein n=1 Tax=Cenococcum geophilum 1.58 TaxID=794803 RepID=UPI00358E6E49|nr:hypothetical protein K441DRAFT_264386 [Cenococcum geophilum 1.58]